MPAYTVKGNNTASLTNPTDLNTTGTGNVVLSSNPTLTGTVIGSSANFSGSVSASNISGTNTGDQTITLTGNVTGSGTGSFATVISTNIVTNSMLAQASGLTLKGNNGVVTGNISDLTVAQVQTMLGVPTVTSVLPIASGGTNANTVTTARQSLGIETVFNGIEDATQFTSVTYTASTRTVAVTTTASAAFTVNGVRYIPGATTTSVTHTATNGLWYFYYNSSGTLVSSQVFWDLLQTAPVATVYYTTSNNGGAASGILSYELHAGVQGMDNAVHKNLHLTRGTQLLSGVVPSGYTLNTNGLANTSYAISAGQVADEDLILNTTTQLQGGANTYRILWQTGTSAAPVWNWIDDAEGGIYSNGTNCYYNQLTGGSWQLTPMTSNAFVNYWILATTSYSSPQTVVLMGQTTYASQALAQAATFSNEMGNIGLFTAEGVICYQMTYGRNGGYGSPGNIRLLAVARVNQSLSSVSTGTSIAATSVTVNTASFTQRLTSLDTNVQQALHDLDLNVTPVAVGGTGNSSQIAYSVVCGGTTTTSALQNVATLGSLGQVLTSQGPASLPQWSTPSGGTKSHWSGYHTVASGWSTASSTFADPSSGNTVVLTEQINSGMGTVSTAGSSLPGITLTFPATGDYMISASVTTEAGSGGSTTFRLTDGTTAFVPSASRASATGNRGSVFLQGIYTAGASATTIKVQSADATNSSVSIENGSAAGSAAITWTIVQL